MAEVLDEFDEATPVKSSYCKRLTAEEYEEEGCRCTEDALSDLMTYLDSNPSAYGKVLQKRRKEEAENSSFLSFIKIRALSYWQGKDAGFNVVTTGECKEELKKMKQTMGKAFEYSLEAKGRSPQRFSQRLKEKQMKRTAQSQAPVTIPTPPPPPPVKSVEPISTPLVRKPLRNQNTQDNLMMDTHKNLVAALQGSNARKKLKRIHDKRSPGGTPVTPKKKHPEEFMAYFNQVLIEKFANTRRSPSPLIQSPVSNFDNTIND